MSIIFFDPGKTTGPEGYINYKLSGGGSSSGGGGSRGSNGLGCGGLIVIILLVWGFLNDMAEDVSEGTLVFFMIIGLIIVIIAVIKFFMDN